jgi:hypothetical protein
VNVNWTRVAWVIAVAAVLFLVLSLALFIWITMPGGGSFSVTPA